MTQRAITPEFDRTNEPCICLRCFERLSTGNGWVCRVCREEVAMQRRDYGNIRARMKRENRLPPRPCSRCGALTTGLDHIVPLIFGGTNSDSNFRPMCRRCNVRVMNEEQIVVYGGAAYLDSAPLYPVVSALPRICLCMFECSCGFRPVQD